MLQMGKLARPCARCQDLGGAWWDRELVFGE